jgi:opacity protein-like surface antigen
MSNPSRMSPVAAVGAALAFFFLFAPPLSGQSSTTRGLNLAFHLQAAALSVEGGDSDGGGGAGLRIGYGVNRIVNVFLQMDGTTINARSAPELSGEWSMAHADLGVRFHFANSLRSWLPYLEFALGGRAVSATNVTVDQGVLDDIRFNGGSFTLGGGISAYFTQGLALDVGLKLSAGEFNEIEVGALALRNLSIDAQSSRLSVGLVWWP